jgi:hypothetical protein
MKKRLILILVLGLLLVTFSSAYAGGGKNGTYVHFDQGTTECHTYWRMTGSGLVHEWRNVCEPYNGQYSLHLVFKPTTKFSSADCDDDGYLGSSLWTANLGAYTDYQDDEKDLGDFLTNGAKYYVCFYSWGD